MVTRVIYRQRIRSTDRRLNRHVHHDSWSKLYPFDTSGLSIVSVRHQRRIPILDQGNLGSCVPNAGIGNLGTDPLFANLPVTDPYALDESGALHLYSDVTRADDYPGQYPPNDTGSDGLTCAKVLTRAGVIAGYTHTFSLEDALKALSVTSFITGINWYSDMFNPNAEGIVRPTGTLAGAHEIVADEYDDRRGLVGCSNSWRETWGLGGRFYIPTDDYGTLLAQDGDVTIFTPITADPPTPTPVPQDSADVEFASALRPWAARRHVGSSTRRIAAAGRKWLGVKGL